MNAQTFYGRFGEAKAFDRLESLGYEVTGTTERGPLTVEAVEAAMDELDAEGLDAFMADYNFGTPRDHWVVCEQLCVSCF